MQTRFLHRNFTLLAASLLVLGWGAFAPVKSSAETSKLKLIRQIKVKGNKNFKERAVRELVKTRPKDFYSDTALREDVQAILASGNYDDAEVETEDFPGGGLKITFKVKERPMIRKIDFTGNKKVRKGKLSEDITLKTKQGFDQKKLQDDIQKIISVYSEKGYPDAKVEPFTTVDETLNQVSINFVIKEGNRVLIEDIRFSTATAFSQSKLRRLIKTKRKKVYSSEKIAEDVKEVETFYKNNGYAKVAVGEVQVVYNPERTKMTLTFPIHEGPRYVVGSFQFTGNTTYTEKELAKAVEMKIGKLYNQEKYDASLHNVQELYLEKGYLNSRVTPEEKIDEKTQRIDYTFFVDEGGIFYIDRVFIEGYRKTKEKVFRREILLKPGDPFSSSKLRRSQEKIFNLGFIDDVKPDIQPGREQEKVDLIMEITEGKPGSLSAGAGYSSTDGLVGQLQLAHSNVFGLAQKMSVMWEFGARRQNFEISWTDPWIANRPCSLSVDLYNTIRERLYDGDSGPDYTETRRGSSLRVGPRFSDFYQLVFGYTLNHVQISDVADRFKNELREETNVTSAFSTELIRDTRDYWFDATRGNQNSIYTEFSGGPVLQGDVHYLKSIFKTSWFFTTFKIGDYPFVISANGKVGAVQEYSPSDDVPIYERFFVGGADSVRGYNTRGEIGPREGGRVMTVLNAEYKIPLYCEKKRRILQLVLFADLGGAWRGSQDVLGKMGASTNDKENERYMKASVGFGLRITTPVFPIRLDWGYGLNHRAGEDLSQIHFTLGNLF